MIRKTPNFAVAVMVGILSGSATSLQAQPSPTLTDFWNTNAVWISDAKNIGSSFWFHYPSAITNGAETWAYYILGYYGPTGSLKAVTGRARSTDGVNWTTDGMVLNVGGAPQRVYESEGLSPSDHQVGRAEGDGWSATKTLDSPGYLVRGPHAQDLNGGTNQATFRLLIDKLLVNSNVKAVTLDVYDETASQVLATQDVFRDDFTNDNTYQEFALQFTNAAGHPLEFRTYWWDRAYIKQDKVSVIEGPGPYWDDRMASFPGIWKDGNTWYLVYEGAAENNLFSPGDIGLATSTDGTNFVKHPNNPILRHNTSGWEHANIGTPSLYKENGTWYLFYHGFDGTYVRIGVASGPSLTNLTKAAANPILTRTSGTTAWDTGTVGKRSAIVKEGDYYYFAFEGSTTAPFDQAKWSSGFARTTNLTNVWTKFPANPIVPQTTSGFGFDGPELLQISNAWYLYVRTTDSTAPTKRFRLAATAPVVIAAPQNILVTVGSNATFAVTARGTPPLSYQWKFGGGNIPGATSSSYTRTNVQPGDAGNYSVTITNVAGSTTSALAFLIVRVAPYITAQPLSRTVNRGTNVSFNAAASGTLPLLYQWQKSGADIPGATSNVLNLTNVASSDEGNYIMTVTNFVGKASTDPATLIVLQPPAARFDSPNLLPDGTLRLVATGGLNFTYTVEASSNLADWATLTNIFNQIGTFEFIDSDATNHGYRFYRTR